MSEKQHIPFWRSKWFAIALSALVIAIILRTFFLESYRMPNVEMEKAILKGDFLFVNKTAYGIGWKDSRVLQQSPKRNDIIIYNMPTLSISRCIGLPGDTVEAKEGCYFINGKRIAQSPDVVLPYKYQGKKVHLSRFEAYNLRESSNDSVILLKDSINYIDYKFFIPQKGISVQLSPENIHIYEQVISNEQNGKAVSDKNYTFQQNYYWLLSDNVTASADSRHFGFIPQSAIIGKAELIWWSKNKNRFFTKVQ